MMEWTDRHCRYFLRLLTGRALLYTEMVTAAAVIHGDQDKLLSFHEAEHPVALQLGGSRPRELAQAARAGRSYGYDEVNLNAGCPSDRVQSGRFGACLMAEPALVADCVAAMDAVTDVPITVKCRIGIDQRDSFAELCEFAGAVYEAGCQTLIVHARKAWLTGLSPKENREIPPLRYDVVHALQREFPDFPIVLNGGLEKLETAERQLEGLHGVMFGRAAYQNPYLLADVDKRFFGCTEPVASRSEIVHRLIPYVETHLAHGGQLKQITRHLTGLFRGQTGGRQWRRILSEEAYRPGADARVLLQALGPVTGRCRLGDPHRPNTVGSDVHEVGPVP